MDPFYEEAFRYTRPFDGQFPRPWMTDLSNPLDANCFVVGRNQRNGYDVAAVSHERHIRALFNRDGESCRDLYESLCDISPTRTNIDRLSQRLKAGGARILETNVICFSTPMSSDLRSDQRHRGTEIFQWVLDRVRPKVIIVHGAGAARDLSKVGTSHAKVIAMPALAPPAYMRWHHQSDAVLDEVVSTALLALGQQSAHST